MLLALDVATNTGWCLYEGGSSRPRIRCGSWRCAGDDFDSKARSLSDHLTRLLREERANGGGVTLAAVEEPFRHLPMKGGKQHGGMFASVPQDGALSNPHTLMVLHAMAGAACAILHQFRIRTEIVRPATWRKSFIGTTRAPVSVARGQTSKWLKQEVRGKAELLGRDLGFHIANTDASDAVGIAFWLAANERRFREEDALRARQAA